MNKLLITLLFSFFSATVFCQQKIITGKITDTRNQPVLFANIALINAANNKAIKGSVADSLGNFSIVVKVNGSYKLQVSNTGFNEYISAVIIIDSGINVLEIPVITLTEKFETSKTVIVQAKKKFIEIQADKTVLNIENSIVAVGNSAFELIKKAPSVTVDKDDNLKLKGGVATIYIDGKPFYLSGEQLTQYLKNLQADAISKIEIIGNPGSKYDAAGLTGIINIRLKKNKQYGTNGSFTFGTGYGKYPKVNSSVSLNHRNKNVNIFSDGYIGYSNSFNKLTYNSIVDNNGTLTYQDRDNYWHPKTVWNSFKAGADLNISKKTVIGVLIKGNGEHEKSVTDNNTIFSNQNSQLLNSIITERKYDEKTSSISYNVNLKTTIDTLGSELSFDVDYVTFKRTAEDYNYNNFKDANNISYLNPYIFRNASPADILIKTAKVDFAKVYNATFKIETGAKASDVENKNYLQVDSLNSSNVWIKDSNRTNTFIYTERIFAGYFNFTKDWKKISLQLGVRAEHTDYSGNSVTLNQVKDSNYTNLFPSAFVTYKQNEKNTWNVSYSRRINRPSYQSLNPFINFIDPYTQFEGNPNLKPSFTQSLEVKHSYKDFLYSTVSYSYTKAQSTNVILQDKLTGRIRNISANVGNSSYLSLNFSASVQPFKWWNIDNNISFGGGNSKSTYPEYEFNQNFFGVDIGTEHAFTLPKMIKIQTSAYYSTPYRDGITRVRASYIVSAGLQKPLWNNKASIKINFNNIIGPSAYRARYLSNNLNIKWINQWEGRRVSLSFNYKFGNNNVKASRQRNSASQEEKNRVNL
ncbi:TonB-dependent receptor domain-containing protein [Ferruginibacter sp.]|nr:TonB-dependent receptor [Ferruginibacter sp.]